MFKRTLLPLIAIASLHASEEANPGLNWCKTADIANQTANPESEEVTSTDTESADVPPTVQSVMRIISYLQRGIIVMEHDINKECEADMRSVAADARALLVKLMALAKMGKLAEYEEGLRAELVRELYHTYKRFHDLLEATYSTETSANTESGAPQVAEATPTN